MISRTVKNTIHRQNGRLYGGEFLFDYDLVQEAVSIFVTQFSPQKIIIFGSVASRTADEDSDIDILVVMDTEGDKISRRVPLIIALGKLRIDTDIVVATPEEFESMRNDRSSFIHEIVSIGYVAYEV